MGMYVVLTAFLFQRGSSESKPIDEPSPQDEDPRDSADKPDAPGPVRRGGWIPKLYENLSPNPIPGREPGEPAIASTHVFATQHLSAQPRGGRSGWS